MFTERKLREEAEAAAIENEQVRLSSLFTSLLPHVCLAVCSLLLSWLLFVGAHFAHFLG